MNIMLVFFLGMNIMLVDFYILYMLVDFYMLVDSICMRSFSIACN